jgi:3',5'-cyclic AMP phosphodiesterase CpdA
MWLAAVVLSLGVLQAAEKLAGGPVAVNVGPRRATVTWVVQTSEAGLGPAPDKLDRGAPVLQFEKITYTGLEPGRTYYYNVLGRPEGRGRFKTAPEGRASFQFVAYGDTRTRHDVHRRVVEAIIKAEPDFLVQTGDLVANGDDTSQWILFLSIEKELLRKAAFFPALGNHDRNGQSYYDAFDARGPYYSFDWGSAHFTILNTDIPNAAPNQAAREAFWAEQLRWLETDLANARKADLRFVVMHHPPFSAVGSRQRSPAFLAPAVALVEKYKVHVVFCGHDHNYQHHLKNGVHYVVTGGGGAPLYAVDAPIPGVTRKAERVENFVKVRVDGAKAFLEAFRPDGSLIERFQAP